MMAGFDVTLSRGECLIDLGIHQVRVKPAEWQGYCGLVARTQRKILTSSLTRLGPVSGFLSAADAVYH